MFDDLALFVAIVESGSLSAAARRAGLPPATVTRRLQQLERQLGCKLLHRSARRMLPTPEGQAYFERCSPLLQSLAQATQNLEQSLTQVQGTVRVLAPMNLAKGLLLPVWQEFLARYPGVQLDLRLSNLREDLLEQGADLAIRVGSLADSSLTGRRLGHAAMGLLASPDYLAQAAPINGPPDLAGQRWIVADPLRQLRLAHSQTGEVYSQSLYGTAMRGMVNDVAIAAAMAASGLGLLFAPLWACASYLEQGSLVPVLPQWQAGSHDISLLWPQHHLPARVRALIDLLLEFSANDPRLQGQMQIMPAP